MSSENKDPKRAHGSVPPPPPPHRADGLLQRSREGITASGFIDAGCAVVKVRVEGIVLVR